jgi:hypothetical protein
MYYVQAHHMMNKEKQIFVVAISTTTNISIAGGRKNPQAWGNKTQQIPQILLQTKPLMQLRLIWQVEIFNNWRITK